MNLEHTKLLQEYDSPDAMMDLVKRVLVDGYRHKHYKNNVEYAELSFSFLTGDNQEEIVLEYKGKKEDKKQQKQRIKLYNSLTQFVVNKTMAQYKPIFRPDASEIDILFEKENETAITELEDRRSFFYRGQSLDKYLQDVYLNHQFSDPNMFYVSEILNPDPVSVKPFIYPLEVPSHQAVDYEYKNGILQYLVVNQKCNVISEKMTVVEGDKFIVYIPNYALVVQEVEEICDEANLLPGGEVIQIELSKSLKKKYWINLIETKSEIVPAKQIGYIRDPRTNHETYVTPLFSAEKIIKEIIVTKSEYDLAKALHGFIQKFILAERCRYKHPETHESCDYGKIGTSSCPKCSGTGLSIHKTVQDVVMVEVPNSPENHIPLDKWVHYQEIPLHIIEAHKTDLKELMIQVSEAVFNKDVFSKNEVVTTATERILDKESVNDALYGCAEQMAGLWKFFMTMTAIHTENMDGLNLKYKFEKDFRLEEIDELLTMRKMAVESSAPMEIIEAIDAKIVNKMGIPSDQAGKLRLKRSFEPFASKSKEEKMIALNLLPIDSIEHTAWIYHDEIFDELFEEQMNLLNLPDFKVREIYDEKVEKFHESKSLEVEQGREEQAV